MQKAIETLRRELRLLTIREPDHVAAVQPAVFVLRMFNGSHLFAQELFGVTVLIPMDYEYPAQPV